jgi:hypothetical protein
MIYALKDMRCWDGIMGCLVCGSRTSAGSYLCGRCYKRIEDPLMLAMGRSDPCADRRIANQDSVILRLGPSFVTEIKSSKGLEPGMTFDHLMATPDRSHLASFIDLYLDHAGVGLELTGEERIPTRELIVRMVRETKDLEFATETWARGSMRLGNIASLAVRRVMGLEAEPEDVARTSQELLAMAQSFYAQAVPFPDLAVIARGNEALALHWIGRSEEALERLEVELLGAPTEIKAELLLKKAHILYDVGEVGKAREALQCIATDLFGDRARRLKACMGEEP